MADGEVGENWEDLEDSGELDKRLQQITILKREPENKVNDVNTRGVVLQEENQRSTYKPTVKILKRQTNNASNETSANAAGAKQQQKTLEQREAEYAEARMRIFGASTSQEDGCGDVPPRPERLTQRFEDLRMGDVVIRLPRGPDPTGSKGFWNKR